jgi:hypothetical protein
MNMVDPLIFAREFCAVASSELSCNDDIDTQGMNYDSTLTIELEEGQGVSVFIDSYSGQFAGPYTLNVSLQ